MELNIYWSFLVKPTKSIFNLTECHTIILNIVSNRYRQFAILNYIILIMSIKRFHSGLSTLIDIFSG